jgi:bifunctional non-homologous end joining protein LigD
VPVWSRDKQADIPYCVVEELATLLWAVNLRAKERPTVSTPVTWDEVAAAVGARDAGGLVFEMDSVVARVAEHGDLFADVLTLRQDL